ncbi:tail fiber assembly protein, partial [Morganella morganii]
MLNTYLFSATENAFYPYELRESYEAAGTWPEKGIDVDESVFFEFTQNVPDGKMRDSDKKGNPVWVDIPPLTHEQYVAIAESQKQALIAEATQKTQLW